MSVYYVAHRERAYGPILTQAIQWAMSLVKLWYNHQSADRTIQLDLPLVIVTNTATISIGILSKLVEKVYRKEFIKTNPDEQIILLFFSIGIPGAVSVGSAHEQGGSYRRLSVISSDAC